MQEDRSPNHPRTPVASVVFTVHNRRDALLRAVALAKGQTVPVEILVMDDASGDGVGEALARLHPDVHHVRSDVSRGPCHQRNRGVALATCETVFVLDDDSMLVSPRTVEQTLRDFDPHDAVLVAIPFQNVLQDNVVRHARPRPGLEDGRHVVGAFVACAHAVRRTPFLATGGYDPAYFYMGEEGDLAIRLLDAGILIDVGTADPIHHLQPPARRSYRADYYGRRNDVLFYYINCPGPLLPIRLAGTVAKGLLFGIRNRCLKATVHGLRDGFGLVLSGAVRRRPVRRAVFEAFVRMKNGEEYDAPRLRSLVAR